MATVLGALDPATESRLGKALSYKKSIIDAMTQGKLPYIKVASYRVEGGYYPPSDSTELKKSDALAWMEKNGFDTSKLK